ncbi:trimeric intracellular cation channel family protein [Candidatus Haliotispira prima]|uniref:Trimeric intracellular cation channel family protein n=1 Tax=Candidatus Haliotispira prima TaxID=3034016 RepID=A0ABY8MJS8_9SPIO|nr:trimeric intracellular cation channel family protein [Candidatus Haliotispira prima]
MNITKYLIDPVYILDHLGVFVFALSGALAGHKKRTDIFGLFALAGLTGLGGGALRDTLIGNLPAVFLQDSVYLFLVILAVLLVFFFAGKVENLSSVIVAFDAIGLGIFTIIGINYGLQFELNWYACLFLGITTATVGGAIRDSLLLQTPNILTREIYASASMAGGAVYLILEYYASLTPTVNILLGTFIVSLIRLYSYYKGWNLPRSKMPKEFMNKQ